MLFDGGETILTARGDSDRARSSRSSSSSLSVSRSHWPGPVQPPEWIDEERAPSHFKCPITLCVMREPAVTPAGITYERSALMQWLDHQHVEPSTKRRLKRSHVVPNLTLRAMIEDWLQHERDVRAGKQNAPGGGEGPGSSAPRGGLPPGAAAVSHADRDALRAVRQRMYAALKERAALGVCFEEQRWEAYMGAMGAMGAARGRGDTAVANDGDGDSAVAGSDVDEDDGSGEASEWGESWEARGGARGEAREVAGSNPGWGQDVESSALSSPPTPAATREEEPPGSLDATLDDDAMND